MNCAVCDALRGAIAALAPLPLWNRVARAEAEAIGSPLRGRLGLCRFAIGDVLRTGAQLTSKRQPVTAPPLALVDHFTFVQP